MSDDSIKNKVLGAIEQGKVKMKPRWHFVLQATLLVLGTFLAVLALVYLVSFIFFALHQTGIIHSTEFGFRGVGVFLVSLPWLLILLSVVFIVVLEILVRKYSFSYRRPLLYTIFGIILLVLVSGFVVAQTSFHRHLFLQAWDDNLPVVRGFYRTFGEGASGHFEAGRVTAKTSDGYEISDPRG